MAEAGVIMIQLGLESFSTPILNGRQKGTSALQNIRVLKWCAEFGIQCFYNVIYGFPGEPAEEYERMADTVASLTHLQAPNTPVRLRLDRFSPYHYNPDSFGIEIEGPRPSRRFVYDLPDADLMEIEYFFTFRYKDNRDPESYVAAFKEACAIWRRHWRTNFRQLSYDQVGDGLRIVDLRRNMPATVYALGALEANIYLACDSGASVGMILKRVAEAHDQQLAAQDVRSFLQAAVEPSPLDRVQVRTWRKWRRWLAILGVVVLMLTAGRWQARRPREVALIQPTLTTITEIIASSGRVGGRTETFVGAQATGIVDKLFVREGDRVMAGQQLAILKNDVAEAQVAQAQQVVRTAWAQLQQVARDPLPSEAKCSVS